MRTSQGRTLVSPTGKYSRLCKRSSFACNANGISPTHRGIRPPHGNKTRPSLISASKNLDYDQIRWPRINVAERRALKATKGSALRPEYDERRVLPLPLGPLIKVVSTGLLNTLLQLLHNRTAANQWRSCGTAAGMKAAQQRTKLAVRPAASKGSPTSGQSRHGQYPVATHGIATAAATVWSSAATQFP